MCLCVSSYVTNRRKELKGNAFYRKLRAEKDILETGERIAFEMEVNSPTVSVALVIWVKRILILGG